MRGFSECSLALVLTLALLLIGAPAAYAQSYEEALAKFAADSYSDTDAAVAGVAASGNPLAAQVIEALQDGRLLFSAGDKKVYLKKPSNGTWNCACMVPCPIQDSAWVSNG